MNAEEARIASDKAVEAMPETQAIRSQIDKAVALGDTSCKVAEMSDRVRIYFETHGYSITYNSYIFDYTIEW